MDIREIKTIALQYREILVKNNIQPDVIILFGSHAKGRAHKYSDIDLAIVSRDFKSSAPRYSKRLNLLALQIDAPLEVLPMSYIEFMKKTTTSPIHHEILTTGIVLF